MNSNRLRRLFVAHIIKLRQRLYLCVTNYMGQSSYNEAIIVGL